MWGPRLHYSQQTSPEGAGLGNTHATPTDVVHRPISSAALCVAFLSFALGHLPARAPSVASVLRSLVHYCVKLASCGSFDCFHLKA